MTADTQPTAEEIAAVREDLNHALGLRGTIEDLYPAAESARTLLARLPLTPSGWRPAADLPDVGRKFVALYDDGSGAFLAWRHDQGFIDQDGDEFERLKGHELWTYLPDGFEFWCETGEEPMTLKLPAAAPQPSTQADTTPDIPGSSWPAEDEGFAP